MPDHHHNREHDIATYFNLHDYGTFDVSISVDFHPDHALTGVGRTAAVNHLLDAIDGPALIAAINRRLPAGVDRIHPDILGPAADGHDVRELGEQRAGGSGSDRLRQLRDDFLDALARDDLTRYRRDTAVAACRLTVALDGAG